MQEVTLIFVGIQPFQQYGFSIQLAPAHIVACRYQVGTKYFGVFKKRFELNLTITKDVRIRGSASFILMQEVLEHVVPVLGCKVSLMKLDSKCVTDLLSVCQVFFCRAVFCSVVFVPVLHEQAFNLIPLLYQ